MPAAPARVKRGSARRDRKCGCVAFRPRMRAGHQCRRLWSCATLRPTGAGSSAADATTQGVEEIRHDVLLSTISQVASRKPVGVNMQTDRPRSKSRPAARQVQSAPASVARPIVATRIVAETKRGRARHMSRAYYKPRCSSCGSRMLGHVGRAAAGRASPGALSALNVVRPRRRLLYPICRRSAPALQRYYPTAGKREAASGALSRARTHPCSPAARPDPGPPCAGSSCRQPALRCRCP